jgi:cation diffusion facilitator CzcD-associated flavoprotein CzcO
MISKRVNYCETAIIGAGPYGLSVAAHLTHAGVAAQVFGEPMSFWRRHMPKGMLLRSPWRATDFSDPDRALSLDAFVAERGTERQEPLPLEDFLAYGEWFQVHAAPEVDCRSVRRVEAVSNGFRLTLADGEVVSADRVVMATGLANQDYRPAAFRDLPANLVTHSNEHDDFAPFRGKHVAVIGRGQSACESAALLSEAGAEAEIVSRGEIHWLGGHTRAATAPQTPMARFREMLAAPSAIGPFPLNWLVELPSLVRLSPPERRDAFTRRCLRAAASGWLKPRFKNVKTDFGRTIAGAFPRGGRIVIAFDNGERSFDHVVLGTGYRVDVSRLGILAPKLLEAIACSEGSPLLGPGLESSVPRLHFVGSYAVRSFGPLMRFIAGASYAARSVTYAALNRTADAAMDSVKAGSQLFGDAAPGLSRRP